MSPKQINLSSLSKDTREAILKELASPSIVITPPTRRILQELKDKGQIDKLWKTLAELVGEKQIAEAFESIARLSAFFDYDKLEITDLRRELVEKLKYICEQKIRDFKEIFLSL